MNLTRITDPPDAVINAKFTVTLSAAERASLTALVTTGRAAARTLAHARVLLKTDAGPAGPGWTDDQIRDALDVSLKSIARIRRTCVDHGLEAALYRREPRTPRARKLDGRAEAHLLALHCSPPPRGFARWTLRLLTDQFVELGVSPPVSDETVRRILKQTRSSPG